MKISWVGPMGSGLDNQGPQHINFTKAIQNVDQRAVNKGDFLVNASSSQIPTPRRAPVS